MSTAIAELTASETEELQGHEAIIEHGLKTFVHVGLALTFIRDRRLYREAHSTFAEYCRKRWDIGRSRGYQLIDAAKTFENVHNCGQDDAPKVMPKNEGQTRELSRLPDEEQADAWRDAVEKSGGQPSLAEVGAVVDKRLLEAPAVHKPLVQHLTGSDEWFTPDRYLNAARDVLGGIELDPASISLANERVQASRFYTSEDNGLEQAWSARSIWLNPPYSETNAWVSKWMATVGFEVEEGILLVHANTETAWFQLLWGCWLCFTDHRIRFERPDGNAGSAPPKGNVFAYIGPYHKMFREHFEAFGQIVAPNRYVDALEKGEIIP